MGARWQRDFSQTFARGADGEVPWSRIISAPRHQPDGSLVWDGIQIDITDQKGGEALLVEMNDELERRVAERTSYAKNATTANGFLEPGMEMITNPFAIAGTMDVSFGYAPSQAVVKSLPLATGIDQQRAVALDSTDIQAILGKKVALTVGGVVNSSTPITVTPKQQITIANRLVLTIRTGGGN